MLVMAAKISHVPSLYVGENPNGPAPGVRESIRQGLRDLGKRARELGVETFVVLDVHWINTIGFHLNATPHIHGIFTSSELPHMVYDLPYDYHSDPELAQTIVEEAKKEDVLVRAHNIASLRPEYGTLLPMRYMNPDNRARVLSIGQNIYTVPDENIQFGRILRRAIDQSEQRVALLASGSLSHAFWTNHLAPQGLTTVSSPFNEQTDRMVIEMWKSGKIREFLAFLPKYAEVCNGEVNMTDTFQLFAALGWDSYEGRGIQYGNYEGSSGTGQVVMEFPV